MSKGQGLARRVANGRQMVSVTDKLGWYLTRFKKMSAAEMAWRLSDQARKWAWSRDQVAPGSQRPVAW